MKIFVNLITTIRFAYTVILPLLKNKISNTAFIINIIILFLTDSIDGTLARKFNVQTLYGSVMDTVADKALSIMLLLLLAINRIDILSVVMLLEIIIAIPNVIGMLRKKKTKSSLLGKIKMWALSITIVLSYMNYFNVIKYSWVLLSSTITITLQILVIIGYMKFFMDQKGITQERNSIKNLEDLKYVLFDTEYYMSTL